MLRKKVFFFLISFCGGLIMPDNRFLCSGSGVSRDTFCIEANRVLDSCRDRDCFENVQVFLTNYGNEIIERTGNIRVKHSCIAWTNITVDPIAFNKGFYSVNIRLYIKIVFEACLSPGRVQEFDGVAVLDKNVVLFGGESNLNVFKSNGTKGFCEAPTELCCSEGNVPTAVVEVVDPIILSARIIEKHHNHHCTCCCTCGDVPEYVTRTVNGQLCDDGNRYLVVSIGIFSVVRIVRPGQYLIQATEYTVPDKECMSRSEENPCEIFKCMEFPIDQFSFGNGPVLKPISHSDKSCGCK
jgi:hypothetical protein